VTRAQENMLAHYVVKGRKTVQGWFFRVDAEIFHLLTACQNAHALDGGVAEIGLHHGKSFIALCLSLQLGQRAYGIDLFDSQHLNFDRSGKGDRSIVEQNLVRAGVDLSSVVLDGRPSDQVSAPDILKAVGHVRFFSIDGGHWAGIVRNDLRLAEATLGECGVIALDDFLRAEWPDVSTGYFEWLRERSRPIVPLAIGCNKLYLCEERYRALYRKCWMIPAFSRCSSQRITISAGVKFLSIRNSLGQRGGICERALRNTSNSITLIYMCASERTDPRGADRGFNLEVPWSG